MTAANDKIKWLAYRDPAKVGCLGMQLEVNKYNAYSRNTFLPTQPSGKSKVPSPGLLTWFVGHVTSTNLLVSTQLVFLDKTLS